MYLHVTTKICFIRLKLWSPKYTLEWKISKSCLFGSQGNHKLRLKNLYERENLILKNRQDDVPFKIHYRNNLIDKKIFT